MRIASSFFAFVRAYYYTHVQYAQMVKISAPYWFHLISYEIRIYATSVAMGLACLLVGTGGLIRGEGSPGGSGLGLGLQLFGVSFMSLACSLGEVRETGMCYHVRR